MGCYSYYLDGDIIKFSEMDDDTGCLCTFPHNDGGTLTPHRVKSLAQLGAAVHLMKIGELEHGFIGGCLPDWINDELDRVLNISNDMN